MTRDEVVNLFCALEPFTSHVRGRKLTMQILFILTTTGNNEMNLQFVRRAGPQGPQAGHKVCGVSDLY
jgi:hypothetical protein